MKTFVVLAAIVLAVTAQYHPDVREVPIPYSYSYLAEGEEGTSGHQETGDGSGRVQGSYSLSDLDGRNRVVEYVADEGGFRAVVRTNEPGTANQNPADVVVESSAPDAGGIGGGVTQPRPVSRPGSGGTVVRPGGGGAGTRFVLVPVDDPRARGYY